MTRSIKRTAKKGFTLAELLIALAILGVIATFTIPKILDSTSTSKTTAIAKEAASMVAGAYANYKATTTSSANTQAADMTNYMNYLEVITTGADAAMPATNNDGNSLQDCSASLPCLRLHNGAYLQYDTGMTFGGTTPTHALVFNVDPDGNASAVGRVTFIQFFNGRLTTRGKNGADATTGGGSLTQEATDPVYIQSWN